MGYEKKSSEFCPWLLTVALVDDDVVASTSNIAATHLGNRRMRVLRTREVGLLTGQHGKHSQVLNIVRRVTPLHEHLNRLTHDTPVRCLENSALVRELVEAPLAVVGSVPRGSSAAEGERADGVVKEDVAREDSA